MTFLPRKKVAVRFLANLHAHIPTKPSLNTELDTLKSYSKSNTGKGFEIQEMGFTSP